MSKARASLLEWVSSEPGLIENLVRKYSGSAPRYTSYPTAVELSERVGNLEWKEQLLNDPVLNGRTTAEDNSTTHNPGLSIYLHIPFCHSLCYFCACNKVISKDNTIGRKYIDTLAQEIRSYRELFDQDFPVEQIHWGGGSPNFLSPAETEELHQTLLDSFGNLAQDAEISVEVDPRTLTPEHLETYTNLGFNRLSLGVQDFSLDVQQAINRVQSFESTKRACETARSLGLTNINIDLIYGLPLQTVEGIAKTIEQVLELAPSRVALYGYAHVTWIKKVQKALERSALPSPEQRIAIFLEGIRRFCEAGYHHIGLDHFALPDDDLSQALQNGRLNRTFMGYTNHRGCRVLAFGVSSISLLPGGFAQNSKDLQSYQKQIAGQGMAIERGVIRSRDDRMRAEILESLLCRGGIWVEEVEQSWGVDFFEEFTESIEILQPMVADGLLKISSSSIELSPIGRLFARNVAVAFDAYIAKHRQAQKPVFSQAV